MRKPRLLGLLCSATAVGLLAGCVPAPEPSPTPTPTSAPSEPEPPAAPTPALAVPCLDLLSLEEVQAVVSAPVEVLVDEGTTFRGVPLITAAQAGALRCVWAGERRTDARYDEGLEVSLLPRAADDFPGAEAAAYAVLPAITEPAPGYLHCDSYSALCRAELLVADYWLSATFSDAGRDPADAAAHGRAAMTALLTALVQRIEAAPAAAPAWVPSGTGSPICATARDAAADWGLDPAAFEEFVHVEGDPGSVAEGRVQVERCAWGGVRLARVPGGAWAFDGIRQGVGESPGGEIVMADVPGLGQAPLVCDDGCTVWFVRDGDLVEVIDYSKFGGDEQAMIDFVATVAADLA